MASVETLGALERRLNASIPQQNVRVEVESRLKRIGRTAKVHGFRPGKVPLKMVAQQYGPQVRSDVISEAVQSSFDDAVRYAQSIGIAETDPSADVDGWDASIKVAALATVLMGRPLKPQEVDRTGIRGITSAEIARASQAGKRWKLVCTARREGAGVVGRVVPQRVAPGFPLYSIGGSSSYVQFELDVLPGLGILESNPGPETTAYGLLADLVNAVRGS